MRPMTLRLDSGMCVPTHVGARNPWTLPSSTKFRGWPAGRKAFVECG